MTLLDRPPRHASDQPDALIEEAKELHRRRVRRRRLSALSILALALAAGGFFAFGGGGDPPVSHGPAPVALQGQLPAGIIARAPDPGGGLSWGIRLVRKDGYSCLQLGRLRGDQLGMVGIDRMFHDDGRFHPFAVSGSYHATCAQDDGDGHAFFTTEAGATPASGAISGYTPRSGCDAAVEVAGLNRARHRFKVKIPASFNPSACPAGDLRFIQWGLLGPDAESISYRYNGHVISEKTAGPDGAYLVVGPATGSFCAQLPKYGMCGSNGYSDVVLGGMISSVRYRNGTTCTQRSGFVLAQQCPRMGYVPPRSAPATGIASPVSARVIKARHYCFKRNSYFVNSMPAPATDLTYIPCDGTVPATEIRDPENQQGTDIVFSFTARKPTSATSAYGYEINYSGRGQTNCAGGGGMIEGRVHVGERLTRASWNGIGCTGSFDGTVYYYPNLGPQGIGNPNIFRGRFGQKPAGAVVVGTFNATIH